MKSWSNIEVSPDDREISAIDRLEKHIGEIPEQVKHIRELITRLEGCHFKLQRHIEYIRKAISTLGTDITPKTIGAHHLRNGEEAWRGDGTGRSLLGQQYVWSLREWLGEKPEFKPSASNTEQRQQVKDLLGDNTAEKERLVRLLIARLTWNWKKCQELQHEDNELDQQALRIDVCHYSFPDNLDSLLQGIGSLRPVQQFEGCGSISFDAKVLAERETRSLVDELQTLRTVEQAEKAAKIQTWLIACLVKTLKEQAGLTIEITELIR